MPAPASAKDRRGARVRGGISGFKSRSGRAKGGGEVKVPRGGGFRAAPGRTRGQAVAAGLESPAGGPRAEVAGKAEASADLGRGRLRGRAASAGDGPGVRAGPGLIKIRSSEFRLRVGECAPAEPGSLLYSQILNSPSFLALKQAPLHPLPGAAGYLLWKYIYIPVNCVEHSAEEFLAESRPCRPRSPLLPAVWSRRTAGCKITTTRTLWALQGGCVEGELGGRGAKKCGEGLYGVL